MKKKNTYKVTITRPVENGGYPQPSTLEVLAHDRGANAAMPGVERHVDRGTSLDQGVEGCGEGHWMTAVVTGHNGRDTLAYRPQSIGRLQQTPIMMTVGVDEPGCEHHALAIDNRIARGRSDRANRHDGVAHDPDGAHDRR